MLKAPWESMHTQHTQKQNHPHSLAYPIGPWACNIENEACVNNARVMILTTISAVIGAVCALSEMLADTICFVFF